MSGVSAGIGMIADFVSLSKMPLDIIEAGAEAGLWLERHTGIFSTVGGVVESSVGFVGERISDNPCVSLGLAVGALAVAYSAKLKFAEWNFSER